MLMRAKAGLFVRDLADRFGISTSLVSRNCITWINLLYHELKDLSSFPTQEHPDCDQMTAAETEETISIASARIRMECAIGRIKTYHLLDGTLTNSLSPYATQIATVCGFLTNFLPPFLPPANL